MSFGLRLTHTDCFCESKERCRNILKWFRKLIRSFTAPTLRVLVGVALAAFIQKSPLWIIHLLYGMWNHFRIESPSVFQHTNIFPLSSDAIIIKVTWREHQCVPYHRTLDSLLKSWSRLITEKTSKLCKIVSKSWRQSCSLGSYPNTILAIIVFPWIWTWLESNREETITWTNNDPVY